MGSDSEKECCDAMRHRIIPKLTKSAKSDQNGEKKESGLKKRDTISEPNGRKETSEERVDRISHTNVSFMEFWFQCLDWEMLRLFFGLLLLFFVFVGIASQASFTSALCSVLMRNFGISISLSASEKNFDLLTDLIAKWIHQLPSHLFLVENPK